MRTPGRGRREREMTRGKQKIEAQKRNAEKNQKAKGSQLEARAVALKVSCPICKVGYASISFFPLIRTLFEIEYSDRLLDIPFVCYWLRSTTYDLISGFTT